MLGSTLVPWLLALLVPGAAAQDVEPDRGFFGDVAFAGRLVVDDAAAVIASPFHMNRESALKLAGVLAIAGVMFAFDEDMTEFALRNDNDHPFKAVRRMGEEIEDIGLMGTTWPIYLGATTVGYAIGNTTLTRVGGEILLAQYISGGIRNLGKIVLGRRRPNERQGAYKFEFDGGTSLPSGHASSAFAAFGVLAHHIDRTWATAACYTLAGTIAYQRLTSESHWASDIWLGAVSGIASARLITRRHDRLLNGESDASVTIGVTPTGQPALAWTARF